jgi:hypothetical protein
MMLSDRQRTAQAMMHELHRIGCHVINIMPLSPHSPGLRFQVLDDERDAMLRKLSEWGWSPTFISSGPRFCLDGTARPASTYELRLEDDRRPIPKDDIKKDDVVSRELKEYRKLHGLSR